MSGLSRDAGCPGWRDPASGRSVMGAGFPGWCRMSGLAGGAGCPGPGRMSGSCSLSPVPLVVLLHPCTWGLVHHSEHLREGLLGT